MTFVDVQVGRVTSIATSPSGWQFSPEAIFKEGTSRVTLIQQLLSGETGVDLRPSPEIFGQYWSMVLDNCDSPECPTQILKITDQVTKLQNGFTSDILSFGMINNVTNEETDILQNLRSIPNAAWWRISHMYSDSMYVQIDVFDQQLMIRIRQVITISQSSNIFQLSFNIDPSSRRTFSTVMSGSLEDYKSAINSLIDDFAVNLNS